VIIKAESETTVSMNDEEMVTNEKFRMVFESTTDGSGTAVK